VIDREVGPQEYLPSSLPILDRYQFKWVEYKEEFGFFLYKLEETRYYNVAELGDEPGDRCTSHILESVHLGRLSVRYCG
jgi:hypothetical protein